MDDFEKLNNLAEELDTSSKPEVCSDLRRIAKIMKWLSEEESPISPGDSMLDYYLESLEE